MVGFGGATRADQCRGTLYAAVLSDVMDGLGRTDQAMRRSCGRWTRTWCCSGAPAPGSTCRATKSSGRGPLRGRDRPGRRPASRRRRGLRLRRADRPDRPLGRAAEHGSAGRGAAGCVTDGLVRDVAPIRAMGFPVFHGGIGPLDSKGRGKMMEMDCRVVCGGVEVAAGDWSSASGRRRRRAAGRGRRGVRQGAGEGRGREPYPRRAARRP